MNWLQEILGEQWNITSAGGATGKAFVGELDDKRLFLKRNSSPFLAVLSAEGIVPKLLWTKRLENGDVVTAQRYLDVIKLTPEEMNSTEVNQLLHKIHTSKELFSMFTRIHKEIETPFVILNKVRLNLSEQLFVQPIIQKCLHFLEDTIPTLDRGSLSVCHGDIFHQNYIRDEEGTLYLVDWDGAIVADIAVDISILLYSYIPESDWDEWLQLYGLERTKELEHRLKWYNIVHILIRMELNKDRDEMLILTNKLKDMLAG